MEQARHVWLVLCISAAWVGTAQFARLAEQTAEQAQHCSIVLLMAWANTAAWIFLAIPHVWGYACEAKGVDTIRPRRRTESSLQTEAFEMNQPPKFLAVALSTNLCYISALHFLPASLNTAIFSTSPIFTLLLSVMWLPQEGDAPGLADILCSRKGLSVALSVLGVLLISEPWNIRVAKHHEGDGGPSGLLQFSSQHEAGDPIRGRMLGVFLSLLAGLGTAVYQVYFKLTFGDRMGPKEVGLFLAHMGVSSTFIMGAMVMVAVAVGVYPLQLNLVPWSLVSATAASSAMFNFLIKFGLSAENPLAMSLATQIGIPLNLLLDVVVVHVNVGVSQAAGVLVMFLSFTLQQIGDRSGPRRCDVADVMSAKLLGAQEEEARDRGRQ